MQTFDDYLQHHTDAEPALLQELNRETHLKKLQPRMLSGHVQGRLLSMISRMVQPENILEIGTYTGYSALCLAEGLKTGGILHTIEKNDEHVPFAENFFKKSPYHNQIVQHIGNAIKIIPTLNVEFDLVFIDGDKEEYAAYFKASLPKLKPGGFMIIDNTLWSGKVLEPNTSDDAATQAIKNFNIMLREHQNVSCVILPLRDGLTLVQKVQQ